jgi:CRP-like cAMP-binding protein
MDAAGVIAVLGKTELFGGLPDDNLEGVPAIAQEMRLPGGKHVFLHGEPSGAFYVVMTGSVRIYVEEAGGTQTTIGVVGPYQTFGEMAVLDGGARAGSAETIEPVTLLSIPRTGWLELLEHHPLLVRHILDALGAIVRRYADQAVECLFLDLEGRMARLLLQLAERHGQREAPMRLDIQLTQAELASMVHGSRQSVNQILRRLEAAGYLRAEHGEIIITDREGLLARAGIS